MMTDCFRNALLRNLMPTHILHFVFRNGEPEYGDIGHGDYQENWLIEPPSTENESVIKSIIDAGEFGIIRYAKNKPKDYYSDLFVGESVILSAFDTQYDD